MSTERDEIEKQVAEEVGFRLITGLDCCPCVHVMGSGEPVKDRRKLWDALVAARLKLAGAEREREAAMKAIALMPSATGAELAGIASYIRDLQACYRDAAAARNGDRAESAALKLAAADRLATAAQEWTLISGGSKLVSAAENMDAYVALRSALLEYSRTKV